MEKLKIYLLDRDQRMCNAWKQSFANEVEIINDNFLYFMRSHENIDGIVSPANCFGIMDGGYDAAITKLFGINLMKKVQEKILNDYYGLQPITTCISVLIDGFSTRAGNQMFLLHTPIMTFPDKVYDPLLVFHAMRNTLMEALRLHLQSIVIPAWGGSCGQLYQEEIAYYMKAAYDQIKSPPAFIDWRLMDNCSMKLRKISNIV